jgi:hypothetical protein
VGGRCTRVVDLFVSDRAPCGIYYFGCVSVVVETIFTFVMDWPLAVYRLRGLHIQ